ncbi:hypothetical protein A2U01_0015124 [Trifolium medium]|uniref:Uncharacterized protein n=1 Tax=Trifolium medium TaxID=97028 RepID=A0A392N5B0_9FABA|nr:hypothetical protein [Trifolium medium]
MVQVRTPVDLNYHPQTRTPFQNIQNTEQFPAPVGLNYHPQTRVPLGEIQNMQKFPAPDDLNYHLQTGIFQITNQLGYYSQTSHFPKMNEPMRSEFDLRNGYNTISRDYINSGTEIHGRVASSADCYHHSHNMTQETRRLVQPMDIAPPISIGARDEGCQYQPGSGSSPSPNVSFSLLQILTLKLIQWLKG